MPRYLFHIHDDRLQELRDLSSATGITVSQLLRQAVDQMLDNRTSCSIVVSGQMASGSVLVLRGS